MKSDSPVEQTCVYCMCLLQPHAAHALTHSDVKPRSHRQWSLYSRFNPERCSEWKFIFIKRCQKHDPSHFETHLFSKYLSRCPVGQTQGQALPTRQGTGQTCSVLSCTCLLIFKRFPLPLLLGQTSNAAEVETVPFSSSQLQTVSSYVSQRPFFHPQPSADVWARWTLPDF